MGAVEDDPAGRPRREQLLVVDPAVHRSRSVRDWRQRRRSRPGDADQRVGGAARRRGKAAAGSAGPPPGWRSCRREVADRLLDVLGEVRVGQAGGELDASTLAPASGGGRGQREVGPTVWLAAAERGRRRGERRRAASSSQGRRFDCACAASFLGSPLASRPAAGFRAAPRSVSPRHAFARTAERAHDRTNDRPLPLIYFRAWAGTRKW